MCRRGGSKGGKHPDDVTDINVGNTATQNPEPRAWRTVTVRIRRKATQWNKHPLGLFYCLNGADLKAKEKAGAMITPAER